MTGAQALTREVAHERRRAAHRPRGIRILRLPLSIARACGIAAPEGFPWHEHRSMAEVQSTEISE